MGGGAAQRVDLGDAAERDGYGDERRDMRIAEAAALPGRKGGDMDLATGEDDRQGEVVARAFRAQLVELRKLAGCRIVETKAQRFRRFVDAGDRTGAEPVAVEYLEGRLADRRPGALAPLDAPSHDLRVQGTHEDSGAPQRDAGGDEAFAQLGEDGFRGRSAARAVDQPVDDGGDAVGRHTSILLLYLSRSRTQAWL